MTRRLIASLAGAVMVIALVAVAWARVAPAPLQRIPTTAVQRGKVQVTVHTTGELRASRAMQVGVPPTGGQVAIVNLAASGSAVKAGDVLVQFDPAEQEFALEQAQFDLSLADQEIAKAEATAAVQAAEDEVALLRARFAVRRAELDASGNELIGAIAAKQNLLLLEEARQRLVQLDQEVKSHRETTIASTNALREKRNKSRVAVEMAKRNIDNLLVRAAFDGFVTLRPNMNAFGGIVFSGAALPEYRVGDMVGPGQPIADLVDISRVEVTAKLSEHDRANVAAGQPVVITVDAVPEATLRGSVRAVSGVASRQTFEGGGTRRFDIAFTVTETSLRVRPGISAAIAIMGPAFDDVLYVPKAAVFDVSGKQTVYVRTADGFDAREVRVRAFTDTVAVVENLDASSQVALVNPNATGGTRNRRPAAMSAAPSQRASR